MPKSEKEPKATLFENFDEKSGGARKDLCVGFKDKPNAVSDAEIGAHSLADICQTSRSQR